MTVMNCFDQVYKGKKVFLTGHTGFKGAWISLWLIELGAEVFGYALEPPTEPSLFEAAGLKDKMVHHVGDVRDAAKLSAALREFAPEFVFHLAAQPLVRLGYNDPKLTYETNIMGTVNLFEAVRACPSVRVVVNVTSDKCYENIESDYGYKEDDPMGGYDPYSSSKGCAELVTSAYRRSFFNDDGSEGVVALSSARAGNVIGGGDWGDDRLIPDCVRAIEAGEGVQIRNPRAVRPWQHVLEPLSGYLTLGALSYRKNAAYSTGWNFGPAPGEVLTVEDIVGLLVKEWGKGRLEIDSSSHPHEAGLLMLDCSKAEVDLGWCAAWDVQAAIEKTAAWYKAFYEGQSVQQTYDYTLGHITSYIEDALKKGIEWSGK